MVTEKDRNRSLQLLARVEGLRAELGISKAELYERSGITQGAFSQWKTGLSKPSMRSVRALASALNTTEEFLLYGAEKPAIDSGLSDAQRELLDIIPYLSAQEATVLLAAAKAQEALRRGQGGKG